MPTFKKKTITPSKRICIRLKEVRQSCDLSINELYQRTKIDKEFLKALEECRFEDLPNGLIYQKNFIKLYLKACGVNPKPYLQQFMIEEKKTQEAKQHPHTPYTKSRFHNIPSVIKYFISVTVVIGILAYLGLQINNILQPPNLVIYSPANGYITTEKTLLVKGAAEKETLITINGIEIMNDGNEFFETEIDLISGTNTIIISVEKKHGKTTTETRYVTLRETDSLSRL